MAENSPLPFVLEPHDLHVRVDDQHYYVRAVRRGESLSGGGLGPVDLLAALIALSTAVVLGRAVERWQRRQPWKVGVIRASGDRWGPTGVFRTVHRETVVSTEPPATRLAELADDVRSGRFTARGG